ncbi:hypothetical protein NDU88_003921 [Pleurodeles waltl]|uniref:Uncharacterized protein n=1 Tax=Pleurodeles waltl TaxID=8319 RepID=A0AAV7W3S6_PLEWA|nr:hypothetical protein NDU88_003921 [Pleurodeles waltl]
MSSWLVIILYVRAALNLLLCKALQQFPESECGKASQSLANLFLGYWEEQLSDDINLINDMDRVILWLRRKGMGSQRHDTFSDGVPTLFFNYCHSVLSRRR